MNTYFISYAHSKGFSNCSLTTYETLEDEITSGKPILKDIQKDIEEKAGHEQVTILYFKRL